MHESDSTEHTDQNVHQKQKHITDPRPSEIISSFQNEVIIGLSEIVSVRNLPSTNFKVSRANKHTLEPHGELLNKLY